MKYLLYGDDQLTLRLKKNSLLEAFKKKNHEGQVQIFSFSDHNNESILEQELSPGFFETDKLFILEDASLLFERDPERAKKILCSETQYDCLFVESQKLLKANKFLQFAQKTVDQVEVFEKRKRNLPKMIEHLEAELGVGSLDARTRFLIQERGQGDDELTLQNIQKVLTYKGNEKVSEEELNALVAASLETKVFTALDALVNGQKEQALVHFQILLSQENIFRMLPLCAWQIRQMLLIKEALKTVGKESIARETGIHPFVVQKIITVLPNFSRARLAKGLKILSAIDVDLKQGKRTKEGALQYFIFEW